MIPNLTIHMMVKNEERYIRQTLRSVLPYAEHAIIIDTGSDDRTYDYAEELCEEFGNAFLSRRVISKDSRVWDGKHLNQELTNLRNEMLSMTETDWVWQVDGDEIYPPDSIEALKRCVPLLGNQVIGLQHMIKWCVSDEQYVMPGPFPQTLRVFPSTGFWQGEFPDEYLWVDSRPIQMGDPRCVTAGTVEFLHMSMALHPERRPPTGNVLDLTEEEKKCLNFQRARQFQ